MLLTPQPLPQQERKQEFDLQRPQRRVARIRGKARTKGGKQQQALQQLPLAAQSSLQRNIAGYWNEQSHNVERRQAPNSLAHPRLCEVDGAAIGGQHVATQREEDEYGQMAERDPAQEPGQRDFWTSQEPVHAQMPQGNDYSCGRTNTFERRNSMRNIPRLICHIPIVPKGSTGKVSPLPYDASVRTPEALEYTVIVTTYRRVEWLEETLTGISSQTLRPVAVLVADDGSGAEHTPQIKSLVEAHGFRFLAFPHSGMPGVSRMQALALVETPWIALCDDDDVWDADHIDRLAQHCRDDVVLVSGNARFSDSGATLRPNMLNPVPLIRLFPSNPIVNSAALIRRESVLAVGGFLATPRGAEDYATWLRLATQGQVHVVNEPSIVYRVGGSSLGDVIATARRPVELLCGLDLLIWYANRRLSLRPKVNRVLTKVTQLVIRWLFR